MRPKRFTHALCAIFATIAIATTGIAETHVGGLASFVFKNANKTDFTNVTYRGWSNFNTTRFRLFVDGEVAENVTVFTQGTMENGLFALVGAYARFNKISGPNTGLQVGMMPSPVGSFAPRTYADVNPLIGSPLMYIHRSSYAPGSVDSSRTIDEFLELREDRYPGGMVTIHDPYWNTGAEFFGTTGKATYSFGAIVGAVSAPTIQGAQKKNTPQFTTRWTYAFSPGAIVGFSGYFGPYLAKNSYNDALPSGKGPADYMNGGICYELYTARGYFELYSEGVHAWWETPYFSTLRLNTGYAELKYTFTPGWYLAGRFDIYEPEKVTLSDYSSEPWDYPLKRYECGVGYKPNRHTVIKLAGQFNRFEGDGASQFNNDLIALQTTLRFE